MKLKIKFIMPTLILILAGMSVTTWLTYQRSTDSMTEDAVDKSRTSLTGLQSAVELWVEGAQNEIVSLSKTDEAANALLHGSSDPEKLERALALLQDSKSRHAPFDNIFLIDRSGSAVVCTNPRMVGADMKERTYFREAITGRDFISNPLFSADGGEPVFVIAAPVRSEGKTIGIISVGIRIGHFTEKFVKPLDTPGGYAFILAPDGLVLAHPDGNLVGKLNVFNDTDYGPKIASRQNGSLETAAHGFDCLLLFEKSQMTGWVVGMAVNKDAAFAEARSLGMLILALSAGQALVLIAGIWIILSINVLRPVDVLVAAATRIAGGDLDIALDAGRRDEIGSLQRALEAMVANLKVKIREAEEKGRIAVAETEKANAAMAEAEQARKNAERAREEGTLLAARQLESIVEAVTAASQSISGQIDISSQGSLEQATRVAETATAMEEMNATVIEVARNAAQAARTADTARQRAGEGSAIVTQVIRSIGEIQTSALTLKGDMTRLGLQAQGIGQIMNVISDIADQTNLLALNAAIEAARAGDAGRGFAVVADEVRKLAEKTMEATKEVGEAISGIQQGTGKNIENVEQAAQRIDEVTALAGKSGQALDAIVTLVDQTTDQVRSIATASEQQSATTEQINRSVTDINRISSETAKGLRLSAEALAGLADQTRHLRRLIDDMQSGGGATPRLEAGRDR